MGMSKAGISNELPAAILEAGMGGGGDAAWSGGDPRDNQRYGKGSNCIPLGRGGCKGGFPGPPPGVASADPDPLQLQIARCIDNAEIAGGGLGSGNAGEAQTSEAGGINYGGGHRHVRTHAMNPGELA